MLSPSRILSMLSPVILVVIFALTFSTDLATWSWVLGLVISLLLLAGQFVVDPDRKRLYDPDFENGTVLIWLIAAVLWILLTGAFLLSVWLGR